MGRLRLARPIVWLDLETTGLVLQKDRIVEISAIKEWPDGRVEERKRRVNPGMPIPPSATAIHGITDEDVRGEPVFERLAKGFAQFIDDADLGGFGIGRFDLPLLLAEFRRAGVAFSLEGRAVLDAQVIFHRREPRDLAAACRFYLGRDLAGAHDSAVDAAAARDVLQAQLERYPDLPADPAALSAALRDAAWVDAEGKLILVGNEVVVNFGSRRGRSLRELAAGEPDYLQWILDSDFSPEVMAQVRKALGRPGGGA
jgi:DNA polymerase-3 subunit epsilon